MAAVEALVELWRGQILESVHHGHAVICDPKGDILWSAGDPGVTIYPRSAAKPFQALPLVESGAAEALTGRHLALACASHQGAPVHTTLAREWLGEIGLSEADLLCGAQPPRDPADRQALAEAGLPIDQTHNNCSGKHAGFLTLGRHLRAGAEYIDPGHPVQNSVREAFEDMTGETSPGYGIDGCSAPNFATRLSALARASARFAAARADAAGVRERASARLRAAMTAYPELVAGEGRACTRLIRALNGQGVVKTGAEGVFIAALPGPGLGIAVKVSDGATRASEVAVTALLVRLGALDRRDPEVAALMTPPQPNHRGIAAAHLRPAPVLLA